MKLSPGKKATLIFLLVLSFGLRSQDAAKIYFLEAKNEIESMLNGTKPLDYERAVFITENAYYDNKLNYEEYNSFIEMSATYVKELSKKIVFKPNEKPRQNILVPADSSFKNTYKAATNFAIYQLITDTTLIVSRDKFIYHFPFVYPYNDPLASNNWHYSQVTDLYMNPSRKGNCVAITSLFKILSLRLNSKANLCTTQGHIFITHSDENGRHYNIELASKAFPGTGSIETITHTTDAAARNGIAMRELNLKQSVALCLINLAKGYQHKFNVKPDDFMLQCADLILKYDSLNLNAMLLKAEVLEEIIIQINKPLSQLKTNMEFLKYQSYIKTLFDLGYREMPLDMRNRIISAVSKDTNYIAFYKDNTFNPFPNIDKNHTRSASLSNGMFEETDIDKPKERYFRTLFDTKTKKIISFNALDNLYNGYKYDPVVFAWCIDPLFKKYPEISPYAAFMDNPVYYIDPDGADVIGGDDFMKKNTNTTAFKIFTQSATAQNFVKQFASSNGNLFTSPQSGALARHNLKFSANPGSDAYGLTKLMVVGDDGSTKEYKAGMTIDASTKFEVNIAINLGSINSKGDAGYAAGVINHEAFVHAEAYANLLVQWEDREKNGMTAEQFTSALNALQKDGGDKEHEAMRKGEVKNFVNTYKELNAFFKSIINSTTATPEEVKDAKNNNKAFNESSTEDTPNIDQK